MIAKEVTKTQELSNFSNCVWGGSLSHCFKFVYSRFNTFRGEVEPQIRYLLGPKHTFFQIHFDLVGLQAPKQLVQ